jgi:dTDP-4-dehydrorhamnose 3,5-epimerase-like enzyme
VTGHGTSPRTAGAATEATAGVDGHDGVWFEGRARTLPTETHVDDRGWLSAVDFDVVGLDVARAFVVGSGDGRSRGGHGHRRGRQLLTLASGRIRVDLKWRGHTASVLLSRECRFLLLEPGVWARQTYLDPDSCLVVFCDTPYDPGDYVHDGDAGW